MTRFQRLVLAVAAILVAVRLFLPSARISTPLLHVAGIIVLAAALFILAPSPNFQRFLNRRFVQVSLAVVIAVGLLSIPVYFLWRNSPQAKVSASRENVKKVAIALETYFVDHAQYPASLEALIPSYLGVLPADPCTGQQYTYVAFGEPKASSIPAPPWEEVPLREYRLATPDWNSAACRGIANGLSYTPSGGLVRR